MRAVIDTNVLLSGLLWHGSSHALLEHVRAGTVSMVSSPRLLAELVDVIGRAKFDAILVRSGTTRERALTDVRRLAEVVEPPPLAAPVCRDPDDDEVLALALAAQVDLIVSGDADLLVLQGFRASRASPSSIQLRPCCASIPIEKVSKPERVEAFLTRY